MNKNDFQPNLDSIDFAPLLSMIGPQSVITLLHQSKTKLKLNVPLSLESFPVIFLSSFGLYPFVLICRIFLFWICALGISCCLEMLKIKRDQKGKDRFGMSKSNKEEMEGKNWLKKVLKWQSKLKNILLLSEYSWVALNLIRKRRLSFSFHVVLIKSVTFLSRNKRRVGPAKR